MNNTAIFMHRRITNFYYVAWQSCIEHHRGRSSGSNYNKYNKTKKKTLSKHGYQPFGIKNFHPA